MPHQRNPDPYRQEEIDLLDGPLKRLLDRPGVRALLISKANHVCEVRVFLHRRALPTDWSPQHEALPG